MRQNNVKKRIQLIADIILIQDWILEIINENKEKSQTQRNSELKLKPWVVIGFDNG